MRKTTLGLCCVLLVLLAPACTKKSESSPVSPFIGSCNCPQTDGAPCFEYETDTPKACQGGEGCGVGPLCAAGAEASPCGRGIKGQWSAGRCPQKPCCHMPVHDGLTVSTCYGSGGSSGLDMAKTICAESKGRWE